METPYCQKGLWLYLLFSSFSNNAKLSGIQYFSDKCEQFGCIRAWELTSSHSIHGQKFAERPRSKLRCDQPRTKVLPGGGGSKIVYVEVADWIDQIEPPKNGDIIMVKLKGPVLEAFELKLNVAPFSTDILIVFDSEPGK